MKLKRISAKDKPVFERFLDLKRHELSVYAFENIYIWKGLFDIEWAIIDGSLCVFFKDDIGSFLYLPPLSGKNNEQAVRKALDILAGFNENKDISRIENVEEADLSFFRKLKLDCRAKSCDYLCGRQELAELRGNKFKSKRASYNYFIRNYEYECLDFSPARKGGCLKLYDSWARERSSDSKDNIYRGMLKDARITLEVLLDSYKGLDLSGKLVEVAGNLKAFTFGFELNTDTFCILYEVADLSVKGLAQFIFAEFCRGLKGYKYINVMDDSGLENLKKAKLSYHPLKLIPAYIVKNNG